MSDMFTIIWKEWKDSLFQGGLRAWVRPILLVGIVGVAWPLAGKTAWMNLSPIQMVVVLWVVFFVILSIVADSFAGELERHTLETLLASRIRDSSILMGKVAIVVLYGWGVMVVGLFVGAFVCSLVYGQGHVLFYPTDMLVFALVLGLLVGTFGASAGVLLSLRMSTVRHVQQALTIGTVLLGGALIGLLQLLPKELFQAFTTDQILLMVAGVVALVDIVLLAFTLLRFRRTKLIVR
jgi:ABC-2 type transport system permease protein